MQDKNDQQFIYNNMYEGRRSRFRPQLSLLFSVLMGLALCAFSVFIYRDLAHKELTGDTIRMHIFLIELYKLGGKLAVAVPFVQAS
jgi:hypothetical protein